MSGRFWGEFSVLQTGTPRCVGDSLRLAEQLRASCKQLQRDSTRNEDQKSAGPLGFLEWVGAESIRKSSSSLKANTRWQPGTNSCSVTQGRGPSLTSTLRGSLIIDAVPLVAAKTESSISEEKTIIMDKCFANAIQPTRTCSAIV